MPKPSKRPSRALRPVMHIFCEGEKTEPNYINGYLGQFFSANRTLKVIEVVPTKKNTPKQLVNEAVSLKRESPAGDVFWVVYDRESEQKHLPQIHAAARNKADANGIHIALSNVCFEVWILLHYQPQPRGAPFSCYDDLRKRSDITKYIPNYDKGAKNLFSQLKDRVQHARDNAEKMNQKTKNAANPEWTRPDQWNPYTDMYRLLDAIEKFALQK